MGNQNGRKAHLKAEQVLEEDEQQHHGDASDDLRVQDGEIGDVHDDAPGPLAEFGDAHGRRRSHYRRNDRSQKGDQEGVEKRGHDQVVLQQLSVPLEGKAGEVRPGLGFVEGKNDQHQNGSIKENHAKCNVDLRADTGLFHTIIPSISSSSKWLMTLMMRRIMTIRISDMAEPT